VLETAVRCQTRTDDEDGPDAVVEIAGYPLTDNITSLVCFRECLIGVHIDDFSQSLLLVCGIQSYLGQPEKRSGPFRRLW
jgi:hypothetical protein